MSKTSPGLAPQLGSLDISANLLGSWETEKAEKNNVRYSGQNTTVIVAILLACVMGGMMFAESQIQQQIRGINIKLFAVDQQLQKKGIFPGDKKPAGTSNAQQIGQAKAMNQSTVSVLATVLSQTDQTVSLNSVKIEHDANGTSVKGTGSGLRIQSAYAFAQRLTAKLPGYTVILNSVERRPELGPEAVNYQFEAKQARRPSESPQ